MYSFCVLAALAASESSGPAVMVLFGKSGLQGPPTRVALLLRVIQVRLSQWGYWVPLFTIWDPVADPGRTPMPGNNSGRSRAGQWSLGISRLVSKGFWVGDYGPGRPAFYVAHAEGVP